eukprot:TRINITY_DN14983_c0_g1_i1.p1 TRINITY_DN14983_c0_g1~~TRINITY_DN14983_c0_g1_i1.p1  ORF type:complete len:70 (-),score=12.00 TRINITY_DN14983_c0_g1_i1:1-210(-)
MRRHESVDGAFLSGEPFVTSLINGYASYSGMNMEPYVFYVNPNTMVRFRLIGAISEEPFLVTVDDHQCI